MKENRSSRNSFLFGSGDMSYSCKHTTQLHEVKPNKQTAFN